MQNPRLGDKPGSSCLQSLSSHLGGILIFKLRKFQKTCFIVSRKTQTQAPGTVCGCELSSVENELNCGWQPVKPETVDGGWNPSTRRDSIFLYLT